MQPNDLGTPTHQLRQFSDVATESTVGAAGGAGAIPNYRHSSLVKRPSRRTLDTRGDVVGEPNDSPVTSTEAQPMRESVSMVPYQMWEGYVTSVISSENRFTADLHDKAGLLQSYSAEISITEVNPEDIDLVKEGAVFYWTFGRVNEHKANSFNFDQIRFRRMPNWSRLRLDRIAKHADDLFEFFKDTD